LSIKFPSLIKFTLEPYEPLQHINNSAYLMSLLDLTMIYANCNTKIAQGIWLHFKLINFPPWHFVCPTNFLSTEVKQQKCAGQMCKFTV